MTTIQGARAYIKKPDGTLVPIAGIPGPPGAPGPQGPATVTAGTTTTLPAGSNATVINSGTLNSCILDFGIPEGDAGAVGPGATVVIGITTTLPAGSNATVTNVGTDSDAILNFGIPKGDQGIQGVKGDQGATGLPGSQGPSGTVSVGTTATLSPGSSATVTNTGSPTDSILNFGIPQGIQGPPGVKGDQGPVGPGGGLGVAEVSYRHVQASPLATWVIANPLGYRPAVTVVDSAGRMVMGEITYATDGTSVTLRFSGAFSGEAYLS